MCLRRQINTFSAWCRYLWTGGFIPTDAQFSLKDLEAMNNVVGILLLAVGVALLIFGFNASHSFSSDVSRFFTGNPTDKSMWLLIGGAAAVVVGLVIAIRGTRRS